MRYSALGKNPFAVPNNKAYPGLMTVAFQWQCNTFSFGDCNVTATAKTLEVKSSVRGCESRLLMLSISKPYGRYHTSSACVDVCV